MKIKIKANDTLFSKYQAISQSVYLLSCMIQNDMEVDESEIAEWNEHFKKNINSLKILHKETLDYLTKVNA